MLVLRWLRGVEGRGWLWLWLSGLARRGRAVRRGWRVGGGADEGVGEVVRVLLGGVGVGVGEFFYSGVLGHDEFGGGGVGRWWR